MAIAKELLRIRQAKAAIKQAIAEKGVEVGAEKLDELPELIGQISGGGGGMDARILSVVRGKVTFSDADWEANGLSFVNTRNIEDLSNIFNGCINLKKIDMTGWNLQSLKNASLMFQNTTQLKSIIGNYTQEDVDNGLSALNGLSCALDLSASGMETPSICAIIRGMATLEVPQSAMINLTLAQHDALAAVTSVDYIALAKSKGWLVGRGGHSDEALAEEIAGTIIGKNAAGVISYVKYADFIKDDFDTSTFTPVAVLAIPRSHTKDGKCRGVSLMNMAIATPEQGSNATPTMCWGVSGNDEKLTNFPSATTGNVPVGDTLGVTGSSYLPTDRLSAVPSVVDTEGGAAVSSYGTNTPYMPSPYMANGRPNPQYWEGSAADKIQCNTDMNGEANTQTIIDVVAQSTAQGVLIPNSGAIANAQANYPAFACCYRYQGGGYTDHSWYLPSCGELGYYIVRWGAINDALTAIRTKYGATAAALVASETYHWSSTECNANYARFVVPSSGFVNNYFKNASFVVRAFRAF